MATSPDICFVYDTTGSMAPCLAEVRRNIQALVLRLFRDIPNLRMSLVAHGDYCDEKTTYLMKSIDFTTNQAALIEFVNNTGSTSGGDYPEAYEYVLKQVQGLSWRSLDARCLVMIGDARPHEVNDNPHQLDWMHEVKELGKMGVNIYSVQCLSNGSPATYAFWKAMADKTNGYHLQLAQFSYVSDMMLGVAYKQISAVAVENFQREVQNRLGGMDLAMRRIFDRLLGRKVAEEGELEPGRYDEGEGEADDEKLRPVPPAKYQILRVDRDCKIAEFVREMGLQFKPGRGFYQFTKAEEVGSNKQIVLRKKATGELFQGRTARRLARIPLHEEKTRVKPGDCPDYDVFIQSTSSNRKLLADTAFLYEPPA